LRYDSQVLAIQSYVIYSFDLSSSVPELQLLYSSPDLGIGFI